MTSPPPERAVRRTLAVLVGFLLALVAVLPFVPRAAVLRALGVRPAEAVTLVMSDPGLQAAAVQILLQRPELRAGLEAKIAENGVDDAYDAHLDPDVARVHLGGQSGRDVLGVTVDTNGMGLREERFAREKPEGVTRVMLLGDSYFYGFGVEADDRTGVHLHALLAPHCPTPRLEVLHVAISSWNIQSECAFLRRHLHAFRPDLVVQLAYINDLGDTSGVRGFGAMARFSPQAWTRGESAIQFNFPTGLYDTPGANLLLLGLDWEARTRYARAAEDLAELADAVERSGGEYLFVANWDRAAPLVRELLVPGLDADRVAFVATEFREDPDHWVTARDRHWNRLGHERFARGLFALIAERGLLPGFDYEPDPEARAQRERIFGLGDEGSRDLARYRERVDAAGIGPEIVIPPTDKRMAAQVTGGLDGDGVVAPYAAFILRRRGTAVVLEGEPLEGYFNAGASATVLVDEFPVGAIALDGSSPWPARFELPTEVGDREYVSVRTRADDYVYTNGGGELGCFRLRRISLE